MARIRSFKPLERPAGSKPIKVHPTETDCFHLIVAGESGDKYLHLSTPGSDSRASGPKSSQSMQFDREHAAALIELFRNTFPDL